MTVSELKEHIDEKFTDLKVTISGNEANNNTEHDRFRKDLDALFDRLRIAETKITVIIFSGSGIVTLIMIGIGIAKLIKG